MVTGRLSRLLSEKKKAEKEEARAVWVTKEMHDQVKKAEGALQDVKSAQKTAEEELDQLRIERDQERKELAELSKLKADMDGALQAENDKGAKYVVNKYVRQLDWVRSDCFHKGWTIALKHVVIHKMTLPGATISRGRKLLILMMRMK